MVFPINHPFWIAVLIAVPLGALSTFALYMRAEHAAHAVGVPRGATAERATRRAAWTAFGAMTIVAALSTILIFAWLHARWPSGAALLFRAVGIGVAVGLSLIALRLRPRSSGVTLLIGLNLLWLIVLGWLAPAALSGWTGGP